MEKKKEEKKKEKKKKKERIAVVPVGYRFPVQQELSWVFISWSYKHITINQCYSQSTV